MADAPINIERARLHREMVVLLNGMATPDRVAVLLDRYMGGLLEFQFMLDLFAATRTPLPAELQEAANG